MDETNEMQKGFRYIVREYLIESERSKLYDKYKTGLYTKGNGISVLKLVPGMSQCNFIVMDFCHRVVCVLRSYPSSNGAKGKGHPG